MARTPGAPGPGCSLRAWGRRPAVKDQVLRGRSAGGGGGIKTGKLKKKNAFLRWTVRIRIRGGAAAGQVLTPAPPTWPCVLHRCSWWRGRPALPRCSRLFPTLSARAKGLYPSFCCKVCF